MLRKKVNAGWRLGVFCLALVAIGLVILLGNRTGVGSLAENSHCAKSRKIATVSKSRSTSETGLHQTVEIDLQRQNHITEKLAKFVFSAIYCLDFSLSNLLSNTPGQQEPQEDKTENTEKDENEAENFPESDEWSDAENEDQGEDPFGDEIADEGEDLFGGEGEDPFGNETEEGETAEGETAEGETEEAAGWENEYDEYVEDYSGGAEADAFVEEDEEYGFVEELPDEAEEEEKNYVLDMKISVKEEASIYAINEKSLFNPDGILDREEYINRAIAGIDLRIDYKDYLSAIVKDTFIWTRDSGGGPEDDEFENFFQEGYLSIKFLDRLYVHVGKENYVGGISYAWNPTDYFDITNSNIYGPEQDNQNRRRQRPGTYMAKTELYLSFATIFFLYAPRIDADKKEFAGNTDHQYYAKAAMSIFSDYNPEFVFYHKHNPDITAVGLNWSGGITDELIIQFELSATKNSQYEIVKEGPPIGPPFNPQKSFFFDERPNRFYVDLVFGINYTFPYSIGFIAEYYYNQEGMSSSELRRHNEFLDYSGERSKNPAFNDPFGNNLYFGYIGDAASRFQSTRMAQHYLFIRLSKDGLLLDDLSFNVNNIINLQDYSAVLNPRGVYTIGEHFTFTTALYFFVGARKSEFRWTPDNFRAVLELAALF